MAKLAVKVVSAYNLVPKGGQDSTSAFVVVNFDSQQFRTRIKFNDVNPVWNESFYFHMSDPSNLDKLVLEASVYGANESYTGDTSLVGKIRMNGAMFSPFPDGVVTHYPLEKTGLFSRARGQLGLSVYITDEASVRAQPPSLYSAPMGLCVEVVSAHDLMLNDEQGATTTCVELTFDYFRFHTTIKENDLNPAWNERFYFSVWDPSNLAELFLEACVYNVNNSNKGSKSFLGKVRICGSSFVPFADAVMVDYPLEKQGMFSRGVRGELGLNVYIVDEAPIIASSPLLVMDSVMCSSEFHVSNNRGGRLKDQSSRPHEMPLQYLKEITNNFSDDRILGHGGFGVVYKGVLRNGKMIAVKKIVSSLMPGLQKQFQNEVYHLMMLNHPNIVQCVGYCYEIKNACLEYNGKYVFAETAERLLCLEYLPNGSLDKYLSDESSGLEWSTRYNIIEGICYGLCHLHEKMDKPILHLDLKPANILLDKGMVPKITDFGLSRLLDQQQTICTSSRDGTFGYMAPEFLHGGTVTPKSDIFSLGVIIMEVVTGHRDYPDVTRTSSGDFMKIVINKWRNVLKRSPRYESLETNCQQIERCILVGLICVNPDRTKRPPIAKIINMLQGSESIDCGISNVAKEGAMESVI